MIYEPLRIFDHSRNIGFCPDRASFLLDACRDKRVLHVGCTDAPITDLRLAEGTLLHAKLSQNNPDVVGIDVAEDGLKLLREAGLTNVKRVDAERMSVEDFESDFDVILAGDVMEHLSNPGLFLQNAHKLLRPDGSLIIGVPNALTANNLKAWLIGREDVHEDHCFYYSPKTLSQLCKRHGFLPTKLVFTVQPLTTGEFKFFGTLRHFILKCCKAMAPSLVMQFQKHDAIDQSRYAVWQ
jgi:2-polyprenyl-3-methyl-5-hydroxy-6-metoxy-1,4-benzoquinol methylase